MNLDIAPATIDALADAIAARVTNRLNLGTNDAWLTTPQAAEHLGRSVDSLHKLTASRSIPFHQEGPRARCYFRRSELDAWMAAR